VYSTNGQAALIDERDFCLRSLRDLEAERDAGDLDPDDYATLKDAYTARAAAALRALAGEDPQPEGLDTQLTLPLMGDGGAPQTGIRQNGTGQTGPREPGARARRPRAAGPGPARPARPWRRRIVIAGAVAVITAGACWAVVASSATRLPGQEITGKSLAAQDEEKYLQQASDAASKGQLVDAVKDYQKILSSNPTDPNALTGEGWLLAQTGEPALLKQGLTLLGSAETSDPTYAPARVYRGLALLSEDDYTDAIPEFQWYLAHNPDPSSVAQVRQALQQAEAGARAASRTAPAPTTAPTTTTAPATAPGRA